MLSKRTITRSRVIFTYSNKNPLVVASVSLASVAVYGRSISLYNKCCTSSISRQCQFGAIRPIRYFASSFKQPVDSEYEIDLITLKKCKKNAPKKPIVIPEASVSLDPFIIDKQIVKTAFKQANEEIQQKNQQSKIGPLFRTEEYVIDNGYTKEVLSVNKLDQYYHELMTFKKYLSQIGAHPSKLTNKQLAHVLSDFRQRCIEGAIADVRSDNINNYDQMCGYLVRLLEATSNPNFPLILENYLVDTATYRAGLDFFQTGLVWFDQEILNLIKKHRLKETTSVGELIKCAKHSFKSKGSLPLEFHDSVYFHNQIAASRSREIIRSLSAANLNVFEILGIIQHPSYKTYKNHVVSLDKSDSVTSLAGKWHLLACLDFIPKTSNFDEFAPSVEEIIHDSTKLPGTRVTAIQLLQGCMNAIVKDPQALKEFDKYPWFQMFIVNDNPLDNYLFSGLLSQDVSLEQIRNLDETKWTALQEICPGFKQLDLTRVGKFFSNVDIARKYCYFAGYPSYHIIPNYQQLFEYGEQLKTLQTKLGGEFRNVDEARFNDILLQEQELGGILLKSKEYYEDNLDVLDELVEDYNKQNIYRQIPDTMNLEPYIKEIKYLKSEFGSLFSEKNKFMKQFEKLISEVVNGSKVLPGDVKYYNLIDLSYKLSTFCKGNSSNCLQVLDSVLINQDVFENLELASTKEYKQIPDDFILEEYFVELCQLKVALEISKFENVSTSAILNKIQDMANDEDIDVEKQIIWRKLYINLIKLFKHNNGNSGVLDTVISSAFKFMEFESTKAYKKSIRKSQPSLIGEHVHMIRGNTFDVIVTFLNSIKSYDNLNRKMFNKLCDKYIMSLDENSSQYFFNMLTISELQENNSKVENYPNFLNHLFDYVKSYPEKRMNITPTEIEEIYKELIETIEYDKKQANPIGNKFCIDEFKKPVVPRVKYNDSETLLKALNKQETGADLEFVRDATILNSVKEGVHFALHEDVIEKNVENNIENNIENKSDNIKQVKVEDKVKQKKPVSESRTITNDIVDEGVDIHDLESFLKQAKQENESRQRETEAFEWSKSQSHENIDNFIKSNDYKYLLVNMKGETIPTGKGSFGEFLPNENIFEAFKNPNEQELVVPINKIKKLSKNNWMLVGSKMDGNDKYFIMAKSRKRVGPSLYDRIKSLFAITGLVLVGLVGANFLLEIPIDKQVEEEKENPRVIATTAPFTVTVPRDVLTDRFPTSVFGKEEFKDVVVDSNVEFGSNSESSWWKNLLWSRK